MVEEVVMAVEFAAGVEMQLEKVVLEIETVVPAPGGETVAPAHA